VQGPDISDAKKAKGKDLTLQRCKEIFSPILFTSQVAFNMSKVADGGRPLFIKSKRDSLNLEIST